MRSSHLAGLAAAGAAVVTLALTAAPAVVSRSTYPQLSAGDE
jgi:hypothetical protein